VHTISKDPYSISGAMIDGKRIIGVEVLFYPVFTKEMTDFVE
jgi:hypothetical protein